MAGINYRELKKLYDSLGAKAFSDHLTEAMDPTKTDAPLRPEDFSILEVARVCFGDELLSRARTDRTISLKEEGAGVSYTTFTNITGRIVSSAVMAAYQKESNSLASLIGLESNVRIDDERMPGFTGLGDVAQPVAEGMPYPRMGYTEDYQDLPRGQKYGLIVPITKEAIFFDRTGQILREATKVGEVLFYRKEKEIAQVILGVTANYNWAGTAYRTYYPGAAGDPWDNIHANLLEDWTDIDNAERLFDRMTDPNTSQPIIIGGMTLLVMPAKFATAMRILTSAEVRHTTGAVITVSNNPLGGYALGPKSRLLRAEAVASNDFGDPDELWWLGDFKRAFSYRENWPVQVLQAPTNSQDEFDRDIVAQYKGTERGVCAVMNPRYIVVSSGSCGHSSSGATECTEDTWPAYDANGGDATR